MPPWPILTRSFHLRPLLLLLPFFPLPPSACSVPAFANKVDEAKSGCSLFKSCEKTGSQGW